MADATKEYTSTLNSLIETLKDGEKGYQEAAKNASRADLQTVFNEYATQRGQFASELESAVAAAGEKPTQSGSVSASIHRGWLNLKKSLTSNEDLAILEECERGEDTAVKAYKTTLEKALPASVQSIITRQYTGIQSAHDKIKSLRDGMRAAAKA